MGRIIEYRGGAIFFFFSKMFVQQMIQKNVCSHHTQNMSIWGKHFLFGFGNEKMVF